MFTLPAYRQRGNNRNDRAFLNPLVEQGGDCVFLGALAGEQAKHLHAKLGFRPIMLTRCWVRQMPH